jgi:O-antigen/teichoic acid export membrane protein
MGTGNRRMSSQHTERIRAGSIRQRLGFLAKDSVIYGGAATLSKMLNLLILPILTRLFSNAEYGALDVMTVWGGIFIAVIIMGQDSAIARFYYEEEDEDERRQIISQAIIIELVGCVALTLAGWFGGEYILGEIYGMAEYRDLFRLLVLSFPFVVALRFSSNLLRWTFARWQFVTVAFGSVAGVIGLTIFAVVQLELGMRGVFGAQIVGNGIFAILGLYFCRKHFAMPKHFRFGRALLGYGFPYMVVALATCVIPAIDRALITQYIGLDELGSYAIGYRYAFMIMLPIQAFTSAYMPFAFVIYKEASAQETYDRVLTLAISGFALVSVAMVAVAEPVIELVASARYLPGYVAVLPILMGLVVQVMSQITGIGVDLSKKTQYHLLIRSVGIGGSALFMWLLVEPLGMVGVGIGFLLGKIAQAVVFTVVAYRVYPLRYSWGRPLMVIALALASGTAMQWFTLETMLMQIGFRTAVLVVLSTLMWFVMFSADERVKAIEVARGYLKKSPAEQET